jgi:hypothetical protein
MLCTWDSLVSLNTMNSIGHIVETTYLPDTKDLLITAATDRFYHPVLLDYYLLNAETGIFQQTDYLYRDIVTPELTDKLGITNYVFGDESRYDYSLYVSPKKDKILYFVDDQQGCENDCMSRKMRIYVANPDGTNPIFVGEWYKVNEFDRIYWGANDRVYITFISEYHAPFHIILEICLDGSCFSILGDLLATAGVPSPYNLPAVSVSPNGQYLAVERGYFDDDLSGAVIFNTQDNSWIELPSNGQVSLPVIWRDDHTIYYPIDVLHDADDVWGFNRDGFAEITLNAAERTFEIKERFITLDKQIFEMGWFKGEWFTPNLPSNFLITTTRSIHAYCIGRG